MFCLNAVQLKSFSSFKLRREQEDRVKRASFLLDLAWDSRTIFISCEAHCSHTRTQPGDCPDRENASQLNYIMLLIFSAIVFESGAPGKNTTTNFNDLNIFIVKSQIYRIFFSCHWNEKTDIFRFLSFSVTRLVSVFSAEVEAHEQHTSPLLLVSASRFPFGI